MNNYNENNIKPVGEQAVKTTTPQNAVVKSIAKVEDKEIKNNTLNIVVGIIIAIVVLLGLSYLGKSIINKQNTTKDELNNVGNNGEITLNGNTCYDEKDYFIVTRDEINDPGENILIKYKKGEEKAYDCEYVVEDGDFEILNTKNEGSTVINFAQYFSDINENKLILNLGTGTKREFQVYNLDTKEKVFTGDYNSGVEDLDLKENILTYWRTTNDTPNKENCSKIDEYLKIGGAKIETKVSLNLTDLTKKEFTIFRCSQAE